MNIVINDVDRPLVIKVASISAARMQVYFIDNEDYFHRKSVYRDENGEFFADNGERAIFFARGVLETVKKLRWAPDIIHCQGWISHVLPLYLKKAYIDDPIFSNSKIVLSLYDDTPEESFSDDMKKKMLYGGVTEQDLEILDRPTGTNLAKLAAGYAVHNGHHNIHQQKMDFFFSDNFKHLSAVFSFKNRVSVRLKIDSDS